MQRSSKWALALVAGLVAVLAAGLVGLSQWVSSGDFRLRAQHAASQALGVPVSLGRVEVVVWPALGVAIHDVQILTRPSLTLGRIEARPLWSSLLLRRPTLDALVVRNAVLPQQSLAAIAAALQKQQGKPAGRRAAPAIPRQIVLDQVTWMDAKGRALTVNAEVDFAGALLPDRARIDVVGGRFTGAKARLVRESDAWQLRAEIGGGTITGPLRLTPVRGGGWRLAGEMVTERVEVAALTAPSRPLTGRLEARTTLAAEFKDMGGLAEAMRSQTRFTVRRAVVNGIDLAKAVSTLGISRGGQTVLDTLTGQVTTQGSVVQLSNLVAVSGGMNATGQVTLAADRSLNGRVNVELGVAGVPMQVSGTLDAPAVNAAGLSLGQGIKGLFGAK